MKFIHKGKEWIDRFFKNKKQNKVIIQSTQTRKFVRKHANKELSRMKRFKRGAFGSHKPTPNLDMRIYPKSKTKELNERVE